ncbi:glutathione S-transferase Z1 [Raphanus sativus]|uniref:Glutathione S-transferase Z1 n=1 Tax=Raphanus sativus TaxID=3726 RepID=A0A9W3D5P8_RAPSA|nr:glutathione S-transferase Z1 [Raphanus sativus]
MLFLASNSFCKNDIVFVFSSLCLTVCVVGIENEYIGVNPLKRDEFLKVNPMGAVPALVDGDVVVSDFFAIIMYLDEKYPDPPLLPPDLHKRAVNYQRVLSCLAYSLIKIRLLLCILRRRPTLRRKLLGSITLYLWEKDYAEG